MAVNLSIKGVPDALADRLRARADRHHRSLQGELMAIIEAAAQEPPDGQAAVGDRTMAVRAALAGQRRGHKTIEQLAAEHLAHRPLPMADSLPRAADIVRADRDAR